MKQFKIEKRLSGRIALVPYGSGSDCVRIDHMSSRELEAYFNGYLRAAHLKRCKKDKALRRWTMLCVASLLGLRVGLDSSYRAPTRDDIIEPKTFIVQGVNQDPTRTSDDITEGVFEIGYATPRELCQYLEGFCSLVKHIDDMPHYVTEIQESFRKARHQVSEAALAEDNAIREQEQ